MLVPILLYNTFPAFATILDREILHSAKPQAAASSRKGDSFR